MKIDKRTKGWRNRYMILAYFLLGLVGVSILVATMRPYFVTEPLISPLSDLNPEQVVEDYKNVGFGFERIKVETVEAKEDPTSTPLAYIRWRGQQEGFDDYTISYFIRIARAESGFNLDPYAKNKTSSAKGIFQFIDGTWKHYCSGDVYNFVNNIDCFYKVLKMDGYPQGLRHWRETAGL